MPINKKQLIRLVRLVAQLKENRHPNSARVIVKLRNMYKKLKFHCSKSSYPKNDYMNYQISSHKIIIYPNKNIVLLLILFLSILISPTAYPHSFPTHRSDFRAVMDGVKGLDILYEEISKGMDSEVYQGNSFVGKFRETFHSLPKGNHRLIGHWGFEGAIPFAEEPYKTVLSKYPQKEIVELWQNYVNSLIDSAVQKTGMPTHQAKGLVGLIYNTHLLGDYATVYTETLPSPSLLTKDISKNLHRLFGNNSTFVTNIMKDLNLISRTLPPNQQAEQILAILAKHNIGEKFYNTYSRFLVSKGIKYVPLDSYIKDIRMNAQYANNTQYFTNAFSRGITAKMTKTPDQIQVVNAIMQEVEHKGKKALILRIPFQFSVEQRVASSVAKQLIEKQGYNNLSENFLIELKSIVKQSAIDTVHKTGRVISNNTADEIAYKAIQWAKTSPKSAALNAGFATFVIMEGISVYKYFDSDMTEKELMFETTKNLTTALATGTATFCMVALGATPGGPIVIAVGIGVAVFTDFIFSRIEKEFTTPEFTFDDIVGGVPESILLRRTIWEPQINNISLFEPKLTPTSLFEPKLTPTSLFEPKHDAGGKILWNY